METGRAIAEDDTSNSTDELISFSGTRETGRDTDRPAPNNNVILVPSVNVFCVDLDVRNYNSSPYDEVQSASPLSGQLSNDSESNAYPASCGESPSVPYLWNDKQYEDVYHYGSYHEICHDNYDEENGAYNDDNGCHDEDDNDSYYSDNYSVYSEDHSHGSTGDYSIGDYSE